MSPSLALFLGFLLIYWLLKRDREIRALPSKGIWVPLIWLAIFGSRPVSAWLAVMGQQVETSAHGNFLDSAIFLGLIFGAFYILAKRNFSWGAFFAENKYLMLVYLYLVCTSFWAEDTGETMKRVFKDFGSIPVMLVLLTERDPFAAIRTAFVRVSYLILTLSVVFIKWFPAIGRKADRGGSSLFCGVSTHKNSLGLVVFVFCLYNVVDIFVFHQSNQDKRFKKHLWIRYAMIAMGIWLLDTCNSKTSLICLIVGTFLIWISKFVARMGNPKQVIFIVAALVFTGMAIEDMFHISGEIMLAVGREPTLTGRTKIWEMVKAADAHPLLGYGYFSFWESREAAQISAFWLGTLKSAHSGFLEMYLDAGLVGLILAIGLILQWFYRSVNRCLDGSLMGRLSFAFLSVAIVYNFSETDYFRAEPLWISLLLLLIEKPRRPEEEIPQAVLDEETSVYGTASHV